MKKRYLILLSSILLTGCSFTTNSFVKRLKDDDIPHPYGNEDVVIEYSDFDEGDIPEDPVFDDSTRYTYNSLSFDTKNGGFSYTDGSYVSLDSNNLAVEDAENKPFPYGTFSVDIKGASNNTDEGIVFGLSDGGLSSYWEEKKVSYYFLFTGHDGLFALGKINKGTYTQLNYKSIGSSFNTDTTYNIKVVLKGNLILCYLNNSRLFFTKDNSYLTGTKFGIRSQSSNVTFSNINVTNDYLY